MMKPNGGNIWAALFHMFLTGVYFGCAGWLTCYIAYAFHWVKIVGILGFVYCGCSTMVDFACEVIGRRDLR